MNELFSDADNNYTEIIIKVLSGEALPEEVKELKGWIKQSKQNEAYFQELKNTWQITSTINQSNRFDVGEAWEKAKEQLQEQKPAKSVKRIYFNPIVRIAAIWALIFTLGALTTFLITKQSINSVAQSSTNEIITPKGAKSQIVLPDGTRVWLNAGSKLHYQQSYNTNHRIVYLEGEAYFQVKTNPKKPFVVTTSEMSVKAYGTAFNVKAYPEEETITTTLVEGIVKIEGINKASKKFEISLKPNQKLTYYKKESFGNVAKTEEEKQSSSEPVKEASSRIQQRTIILDSNIKTSLYTAWKDDRWIIERENLDKLVVMLERRFDVTFIYKSEAIKYYKVSGTIKKETLEQVLDILKLTVPLKYEIKDGIVTLDLDKSRTNTYLKLMN